MAEPPTAPLTAPVAEPATAPVAEPATAPVAEPATAPAAGRPLSTEHFRVPMGDTDAAQIIYFGAPPRWAERLFTGYLADAGLPTSALLASGRGLPAVDLHVTYRRPLRLDDEVRGELRVHRRSARSITWQCDYFKAGASSLALRVLVTQVSVLLTDGRPLPVPLPAELLSLLDTTGTTGTTGTGTHVNMTGTAGGGAGRTAPGEPE